LQDGAPSVLVIVADDPLSEDYPVLATRAPFAYALALVITKGEDYTLSLETTSERPSENPPAAPSTSALLEAMGYDPIHPDILAQQTNMAAADVYAQLLEYELDGIVAALPGGRYQRVKA